MHLFIPFLFQCLKCCIHVDGNKTLTILVQHLSFSLYLGLSCTKFATKTLIGITALSTDCTVSLWVFCLLIHQMYHAVVFKQELILAQHNPYRGVLGVSNDQYSRTALPDLSVADASSIKLQSYISPYTTCSTHKQRVFDIFTQKAWTVSNNMQTRWT
jgi:hypothetical protein